MRAACENRRLFLLGRGELEIISQATIRAFFADVLFYPKISLKSKNLN